MSEAFLSVEGVTKRFRSAGGEVIALEDVSITVEHGECHAIIGESGSGKSTLGGLILGLIDSMIGGYVPQIGPGLSLGATFAVVVVALYLKPSGLRGRVQAERV